MNHYKVLSILISVSVLVALSIDFVSCRKTKGDLIIIGGFGGGDDGGGGHSSSKMSK